jgi:thiamine-phosphate pyrophosphorylase
MRCEDRQKNSDYLRLYLILEEQMLKLPLEEFIPAVVSGGVTAIQLRNKEFDVRRNYETGMRLMRMLEGTETVFVVNDRVDLALALGASRVHLGVKDIPLKTAAAAWPQLSFGYSCNTSEDLLTAVRGGACYIGVGPAFATDTKKDLRELRGPDGIRRIVAESPFPAVAIGGINRENIALLKKCGLAGVAVSSSICASKDPYRDSLILSELAGEICERV